MRHKPAAQIGFVVIIEVVGVHELVLVAQDAARREMGAGVVEVGGEVV